MQEVSMDYRKVKFYRGLLRAILVSIITWLIALIVIHIFGLEDNSDVALRIIILFAVIAAIWEYDRPEKIRD